MKLLFVAGRRALFGALAMVAAGFAMAATSDNSEADRVLDRWVEASGGLKKLKAIKCSEVTIRYTQNSFSWEVQLQCLPDGRYRGVMQTRSGEVELANDGHYGWMRHTAYGGKVMTALEAERDRNESGPLEPINARASYPQRRLLPDATMGGKTRHVVELTDKAGHNERWFFDPVTGFRVRREVDDPKRAGATIYSDFRKIDGILQPFRSEVLSDRGSLTIEYTSVTHRAKPPVQPWTADAEFIAEAQLAEKTLSRFREQIASDEVAAKIKTRVTHARLEIPTNGVTMQTTISQKGPNKALTEYEAPGLGRTLTGFDGRTGWMWSELQGYRELAGAELVQTASIADMQSTYHLGENTPFRRVQGESTDAEGHKLIALDLGTAQGSAGVHYFDKETGLLVKVETTIATGPGGSAKVVAEMSDYREIGGERMAFVTKITNPAFQVITTLESVEQNVELSDEIFLPRKKGELSSPAGKATEDAKQVPAPTAVPTPAAAPAEAPAK